MANRAETKLILVDGIRLAYRDLNPGASQTIVLLHGLAETCHFFWEPLLNEFQNEYRIIAFDLLGHGGSETARTGYESDHQAGLFVKALNDLGVQEFTLIAHSLGGTVGLCIALGFPERVKKLVLYSVPISRGYWSTIFEMMRQLSILTILPGIIFLPPYTGRIIGLFPTGIRSFLLGMTFFQWRIPYKRKLLWQDFGKNMIREAARTSGIGLEKTVRDTFLKSNLLKRLPEVKTPILFIKGSNDFILSEKMTRVYIDLLPNASLHKIDSSGHISLLDKPEEFNQVVRAFIQKT
jgi:pimeloyl-ACP methyl ester carboxylesterase